LSDQLRDESLEPRSTWVPITKSENVFELVLVDIVNHGSSETSKLIEVPPTLSSNCLTGIIFTDGVESLVIGLWEPSVYWGRCHVNQTLHEPHHRYHYRLGLVPRLAIDVIAKGNSLVIWGQTAITLVSVQLLLGVGHEACCNVGGISFKANPNESQMRGHAGEAPVSMMVIPNSSN
ncbi:hypothetical protein HAX54_028325, partial [Datura stramonium]|nr:hypothetical protein [Datura stramonium]